MKKSIAFFIFSLLVLCDVFSQGVGAFTQCAGQAIDLGADKTFCEGDSVTLTANGTYDRIVWSNGASTSSITVKTSGTYIVHGLKASTVDLITNGDFRDTIIAFTTDYLKPWGNHPYGQNGNPGLYNIVKKADNAWWDFNPTCYDHTSGNGTSFMFGANGYNSLNKRVWCQTVPVQPGKNYNVSAWATALAKKRHFRC
ncbi:MAG: hypothetical protein ACO3EE_02175 [Flavobacteriales bacterium]